MFQVVSLASKSAADTLAVCGRQSVKDLVKVGQFAHTVAVVLTSKDAIRTYRAIGRAVQIACMVAIALGWSTRDLVRWFIAAQQPSVPVVVAEVEDVAPAVEPEPQVEEIVAVEPGPVAVAAKSMVRDAVLVVPVVASVASTPKWAAMTAEQLRRECQQRQIKWRNAHAVGRHLSNREMIAALSAV